MVTLVFETGLHGFMMKRWFVDTFCLDQFLLLVGKKCSPSVVLLFLI